MLKTMRPLLISLALFASCGGSAFASGFAIVEQSVTGLGNSFAGGAAAAEDASTIFYNPAGLTLLEGQQIVAGVHYIMPSTKFSSSQATNALGGSLGSNDGGQGGVSKFVPNFYYSNRISDKLAVGLGINAPFGLATKYDKDWVGRYHAIESDVSTININPVLAIKVTDNLSIGVGVSAQYIDATLSSMVDGGLVYYKQTNDSSYVSNTDFDILAENTGDDWGYGFNLGILYELSDSTRIGAAYRSEVKHKLKGQLKAKNFPSALAPFSSAFATQDITAALTLPETASFSVYHQLTDKLAIMGDITWTGWSSFDKLTIEFDDTFADASNSTTTENWNDTWRYSLGATYQVNEMWVLRSGVAFDETPISDKYRTPRIPGEDRIWLSLGTGIHLTDRLSMDAAYAHLFVADSKLEKSAADPEDTARGTVIGEYENSVDIVSIQFTYNF